MSNNWEHLRNAAQRREGILENSARFSWLHVTYETEGTGEHIPSAPLMFVTPFFSKPMVAHGFEVVRRPDNPFPPPRTWGEYVTEVAENPSYSVEQAHADYLAQYSYMLPRVTAGVYRWVRNPKGYFTGCFAYFNIQADFIGTDINIQAMPILHHVFTFSGESYKSMSEAVNEGVEDEEILPLLPPQM